MAKPAGRRMSAEIDGDFVVFLIGAFPDKFHLVRSFLDLGGRRGMKHMLDYLTERPDKGLLGYQMGWPAIVQYWRSFDHLEAFANDASDPHLAAWRNYWKRVGTSPRTGIWHETYLVRAGEHDDLVPCPQVAHRVGDVRLNRQPGLRRAFTALPGRLRPLGQR